MATHEAHGQRSFSIRFDWGTCGADAITEGADIAVVVDVLSFTTTLSVAVDAGIDVLPCRWQGERARELGLRYDAAVAVGRSDAVGSGISLSPSTIRSVPDPPARLVLPSPNGSTIAEHVRDRAGVCVGASLRNARAVSRWLVEQHSGSVIAVVAAGERWPDDTLRPATEDLWGAGAVIDGILDATPPTRVSVEARAAASAWRAAAEGIAARLCECASGRELISAGYATDVALAAEVDSSRSVPIMTGHSFVDVSR